MSDFDFGRVALGLSLITLTLLAWISHQLRKLSVAVNARSGEHLDAIKALSLSVNARSGEELEAIRALWKLDPHEGMPNVLARMNFFADSDQRHYVRATSLSLLNLSEKSIYDVGRAILDQVNPAKSATISIKSIDPAYDFMKRLIDRLPEGSVYLATSKLTDYGAISHPDFAEFRARINDRVANRELIGYRLYYSPIEASRQGSTEMLEIANMGFIVREVSLGSQKFADAHDLALVFAPRPKSKFDPSTLNNCDQPLDELQKHCDFECAVLFDVRSHDRGQGQFVKEVIIQRPQDAQNLSQEFRANWARGRSVHPSDKYRVFISYSHAYRSTVTELHKQLENLNVRAWLDEHDLPLGNELLPTLADAIQKIPHLIVFVGKDGLTEWQKRELAVWKQKAREPGRKLFGILHNEADDKALPPEIEARNRIRLGGEARLDQAAVAKRIVDSLSLANV